MGRKRKQGIQLLKNLTIEDLMESEGDESSLADLRRMMIRMFDEVKEELKENCKNNSTNPKRTQIKKKKTQEDTETTK
jgi:hypothetical protein